MSATKSGAVTCRVVKACGLLAVAVSLAGGSVAGAARWANHSILQAPSAIDLRIYRDPRIHWPSAITAGPDGALWFINGEDGTSIGRITTSGTVTIYQDRRIHAAEDITTGPDGALWFTNGRGDTVSSIGRISASGQIAVFTDRRIKAPGAITTGPDGALWFCNDYSPSSIVRITVGGAVTTYTHAYLDTPGGITPGPDGALWFTTPRLGMAGGDGVIWRITTAGKIKAAFDDGIGGKVIDPGAMTNGPDRALWFTDLDRIARITTSGKVRIFTGKSPGPRQITRGPDGALWFTDLGQRASARDDSIRRITTNGSLRRYFDPRINQPGGITAGPDHSIWFTNIGGNSIGRIVTPSS